MWYNKYIGLPYQDNGRTTAGIDCWGLACLVYREHLGIELPDLNDSYSGSTDIVVKELVNYTKESWIATKEPKSGDICVFNILGEPTHVGIYIGEGKFLHARAGQDSVIESLSSIRWNRRLEGTYRYNSSQIQLVGAPHPLQLQNIITDWAPVGTSIYQLTQYIQEKYKVSNRLLEKIIVFVDGMPIQQQLWQSTKLLPGQTVAYRIIPQGGGVGRLLLTFAIIYAAISFGPEAGKFLADATAAEGVAASTAAVKGWTIAAQIGINMAGMALINAIAPIRQPKQEPGIVGLNLFNGSSNQISRFGAIPVVLGKVRMAAVHGATPYIESLQDTSIINMALVWGFGPLDISDIQVGLTPMERFYTVNLQGKSDQATPVTLYGYSSENTTAFDQLYGQDVTQQIVNADLVNNPTDNPAASSTNTTYTDPEYTGLDTINHQITGGPWREVTLTDQCTRIDLAFTFPQGLRSIKGSDEIAGAPVWIELQYKIAGGNWTDVVPFANNQTTTVTNNGSSTTGWHATLQRPEAITTATTTFDNSVAVTSYSTTQTYQWHIITLQSGGGINVYSGTPTEVSSSNPSSTITDDYTSTQYNSIATTTDGLSAQYNRLPQVPSNHIQLYQVCLYSAVGTGTSIWYTSVDKRSLSGTVTGLQLTHQEDQTAGTVALTITPGNISNSAVEYTSATEVEKFSSKEFTSGSYIITDPGTETTWCSFLNEYGRWCSYPATTIVAGKTYKIATVGTTNFTALGASANTVGITFVSTGTGAGTGTVYTDTCDITQTWTVAETGVYKLYASSDNTAKIYIDGNLALSLDDENSWGTVFNNSVLIEAGARTIRIVATNSNIATSSGVGIKFTLTRDGQNNPNAGSKTLLVFGNQGSKFFQRKDAFNDTYTIRDLPLATYSVRVRRYNRAYGGDLVDNSGGFYRFDKSILYSVTGYNNNKPITNPAGCYLARTAIRLQSTGKVNGTVDGINALVQTRGYDVVYTNGGTTKTWTPNLPINNPASLFRYVLQHPANMYAVSNSDIDLDQLIVWHNFCNINKFTYNNVLTNTQSVMDVLREICAAGLASPSMINGKWSVVIDKPRDYVTQHFTQHNSWGFESTKALPKIPDAFRVTINNEDKAYQPDEFFVYREGVTSDTAKIYEQLSLGGVTNKAQATYLAKWHFAQLKLRPETYKLNVDFEYLVCTRGDLVRVSHDIPQWGTGNGRITGITYNATNTTTTVTLSEQVYLDATKNYCIRFRSNSKTFYSLGIKDLKANSYTTGYTNTIVIGENLSTAGLEWDNLYMLGEKVGTTAKDSQELVVLSIEPTSNTSAVLTLTDYSSQIYLEDFQNLVYDPGITGSNNDVIVNSITDVPILQEAISDSALAELSSPGVYTNILKLSIAHPSGLSQIAQKLQIQYVDGTESLNSDSMGLNLIVDKTASAGIEIRGLVSGQPYKFRARYLNNLGTIRGPWSSPPFTAVVVGKKTNNLVPPAITVELDDYWLVITPSDNGVQNDQDFKTFEYRAYKSSGTTTEDFWDLGTSLSTIKFVQSRSASRIDLRTFDQPRISEAGTQYRIGCRVLDNSNNYSSTTTLNSFTLKTIVEEDPED